METLKQVFDNTTSEQKEVIKDILHSSTPFTGAFPESWKCKQCKIYSTRPEYHKCESK